MSNSNKTFVTKQEFINWIMQQPPDRKLDMTNSHDRIQNGDCGCLMIEYVRDDLKASNRTGDVSNRFPFLGCSFRTISCGFDGASCFAGQGEPWWEFMGFTLKDIVGNGLYTTGMYCIETFGDVQKKLIEEGQVHTL